jgi:hypothetical protein
MAQRGPELPARITSGIVQALFSDSALNITIAAIDCRARMGLKRHAGSFAAASAVYRKRLAARAEIFAGILILDMLAFFGLAAWGTTPGYINETSAGMQFLLCNRKIKAFFTIRAVE